jgi:transcriptional regulator with XRE-family HTH domain
MIAAANDSIRESRQAALRVFLRAHRARVPAASVGLPLTSTRRLPGLRREDVAELAGVSLGWYARFELGQLDGVSERVTDAIARALQLNDAEAGYLRTLAHSMALRAGHQEDEGTSGVLRSVVEAHTAGPAGIFNSRYDVLASNAVAQRMLFDAGSDALSPNLILANISGSGVWREAR